MKETESPPTVQVRARDVKPYHYGIWCSIGDGKPFVNTICGVRWSEDGNSIWFMLESHNFDRADPDEVLDLVEERGTFSETLREKYKDFVLGDPPQKLSYEDVERRWSAAKTRVSVLERERDEARAEAAATVRMRSTLERERDEARADVVGLRRLLEAISTAQSPASADQLDLARMETAVARAERDEARSKAFEEAIAVCVQAIVEDPSCYRTTSYVIDRIRARALDASKATAP